MAERHWYLKHCQLFERLPATELADLETCSRHRKFASGSVVYLPADQADGVLALVSGRVKICHINPDGKETILAFIEPGEVFGELCLLDNGGREELAMTVAASVIVLVPRAAVLALIERQPLLAFSVTRLVGLRRQRLERRLKYLLFRSNRDRLVHLLLELSAIYGVKSAAGLELRLKLAHQDLASLIGSTRETVSATLGELQAEGLVRLGRQQITITNHTELERIAQSEIQVPSSPSPPRAAVAGFGEQT